MFNKRGSKELKKLTLKRNRSSSKQSFSVSCSPRKVKSPPLSSKNQEQSQILSLEVRSQNDEEGFTVDHQDYAWAQEQWRENQKTKQGDPVGFLDFCPPDEIRKSHPEREISCDTICASPSQDLSQHLTLFPSPRVSPLPLKRSNVFPSPRNSTPRTPRKTASPFPKVKEIIKGSLKEEEECLIDSSPQRGPSFFGISYSPSFEFGSFLTESGKREAEKRDSDSQFDLPPLSPRPLAWEDIKFQCHDYESISNCLVNMTHSQRKEFFIAFDLFGIDSIELFKSMKKTFFRYHLSNEEQTTKLVEVMRGWWATFGRNYQNSHLPLAKEFEQFFQSIDSKYHSPPNLFLFGRPSTIAQAITSIMWSIFQNLHYSEFLDGSWEAKDKNVKAPHLLALSEIFNQFSSRVVESILFCDEHLRHHVLVSMIKLAKCFWKINNFEGLAAVISGLNHSSIQRLKLLWAELNSKQKRTFEFLDEVLCHDSNFRGYQKALQAAEPPVLPWIAPKLRELRYLYDGNPKKSENGDLNLSHMMAVGASIKSFLDYQKIDYSFSVEKRSLFFQILQFPSFAEEICYQKSLEIQPLSAKTIKN